MVDDEHANVSAVVGVNGAGGIQYRDAVFEGKAGPRPNLEFGAHGQRCEQSGWDQLARTGLQYDRSFQLGPHVHAGA